MTRRGFYECNLCGFASTEENDFRGVVMDGDEKPQRLVVSAICSAGHVCIGCMHAIREYITVKLPHERRRTDPVVRADEQLPPDP